MTLSEAIRLGAMLKPQAFATLWDGRGGACALGAAFDAIGIGEDQSACDVPEPYRSWLGQRAECPVCPDEGGEYTRQETIAHLNDMHRWTRERIADWVETTEAAEVPAAREAEALGSVETVNEGNANWV